MSKVYTAMMLPGLCASCGSGFSVTVYYKTVPILVLHPTFRENYAEVIYLLRVWHLGSLDDFLASWHNAAERQ